jgi:menaquinone reductase, multiheme cytochrome c subunit
MELFFFPRWTNKAVQLAGALLGVAPIYLVGLVWYGASPKTMAIGYMPDQPIPYSHALHAGDMGLDCRYCHNTVEKSAHASIPPTETCMNCHTRVKTKSPRLEPLRDSWESGKPVVWTEVHHVPDYVYFNHSAHVTRGVGCVSCHGRVDEMKQVFQHEELSMGWCLDCHRAPENHLRPVSEVTNMQWAAPEGQLESGTRLKEANHINPPTDCTTCHR